MKVTEIKTHLVRSARGERSPWVFVEIHTDEGIVGLGDATNWPGGAIIKKAIEDLSQFVIGEDPFHIEYLYYRMYRALDQVGQTGVVIAAISGIEIALWDIVGQTPGRPIYDLIGGPCRDRVRFYSHVGTPEECALLAEKGCTAIKAYFPLPRCRRASASRCCARSAWPKSGRPWRICAAAVRPSATRSISPPMSGFAIPSVPPSARSRRRFSQSTDQA